MSVQETVGVKVKADDSQATAAFTRLARAASGFAAGLRANVDRLKDFAGQLDSAAGSMRRLLDLAKGAGEMRQAEASFKGTGAELGRLQRAVDGTVDKMRLMGFANKAMRGEFHLTQGGMEQVLAAADAMNDQGFGDTIEIAEKMARALKTGSTRSLREYGITVDETKDKQKIVNDLMSEFKRIASDGAPEDAMNKRFEQFNARLTDSINRLKMALGTLVLEFIDHVAELNEQADLLFSRDERSRTAKKAREIMMGGRELPGQQFGRAAGFLGDLGSLGGGPNLGVMTRGLSETATQAQFEAILANDPALARQFQGIMTALNSGRDAKAMIERAAAAADVARGGMAGKPPPGGGAGAGFVLSESRATDLTLTGRFGKTDAFPGSARGGDAGSMQAAAGKAPRIGGEDMALAERQRQFDELMADMANRQKFAGAAFGALSDGIAASVGAAIDGSESMGKAFLRAAAASLKATAIQATINALWETAQGFAKLATGNPAAAAHFKAAAIFAATAAAAGAGSAALGSHGGGGGGGGSGARASGPSSGGFARGASGGGGGGGGNTIILVGDVFGRRPEDIAADIEKARRQGKRTGRVIDGAQVVRFSG